MPFMPHHVPTTGGRARRGAVECAAAALVACVLALPSAPAAGEEGFGFEQVIERARSLASQPYAPPPPGPQRLLDLDFDQWRTIHYPRRHALWPGHSFRVEFTPVGYLFKRPVEIHLVEDGEAREREFAPGLFDYDPERIGGELPPDLGYSGFRILYPVNDPEHHDEVLTFLGASYFRALGRGQVHGLSARGLAVDTALPKGEEFPHFRAFWLVKPPPEAETLTLYALLDSDGIAGAYKFVLDPGEQTVTDVRAVLFPRRRIAKLGLAPLTSMYLYGVGDHKLPQFAFPAIHDSDGLLIRTASEQWIWRPLVNPEKLQVSKLDVDRIQGFGLMQRDRNPRHFDPGLDYARRPSAWITRLSAWGKGHLELIEIPTPDETNDNIVAFWVPEEPPAPGEAHELGYRIHWQLDDPVRSPYGRVVATRIGGGEAARSRKYVVDFRGGPLADLGKDAAVTSVVEAGDAELLEERVEWDPYGKVWRLVLQAVPKDESALPTLRAHLVHEGDQVSEIWDYRMQPQGR